MKIDVLGTEYDVIVKNENDYSGLIGANGLALVYEKEIYIESDLFKNDESNHIDYTKKVILHELVHAFFHESGLQEYCEDEKLVNWIALQMPKIAKAHDQVIKELFANAK